MIDFLPSLISGLFQIVIFAAIPFAFWFFTDRKINVSFNEYVGLVKPKLTGRWYLLVIICAVYYFIYSFNFSIFLPAQEISQYMLISDGVVNNTFLGRGSSVLGKIFITAFIKNGFCEELLFRGFLCKRLMKRFGDNAGIVLQGAIFAIIHNIMFAGIVPAVEFHILIFLVITLMSSLLAVLNEKFFSGSIYCSVLIHGLGNFISYMHSALM